MKGADRPGSAPDQIPSSTVTVAQGFVAVPPEEARLAKQVLRILRTGKNAEVRRDAKGKPQVFRITREIDN